MFFSRPDKRTNSLQVTGPFAFTRTGSSLPSKPVKSRSNARFTLKPGTPLWLKVTVLSFRNALFATYFRCGILSQFIGIGSGKTKTGGAPVSLTTVREMLVFHDPGVDSLSPGSLLVCRITSRNLNRRYTGDFGLQMKEGAGVPDGWMASLKNHNRHYRECG
jgi:hypothetical protein